MDAQTGFSPAAAAAAAADANDAAQFAELKTQGELTRRAWEKNVQVRRRSQQSSTGHS
jgi:phosphomethylpyrimidine synthase